MSLWTNWAYYEMDLSAKAICHLMTKSLHLSGPQWHFGFLSGT